MDKSQIYRPLLQKPYRDVALKIADKINETALDKYDDLDICRMALAELWKRAYPGEPFPHDATILLRRYDIDPGVKIVQSI